MPANFDTFLEKVSAEGGFPTDDVLRVVLPLFEQVQAVHESGKVAPLEGTSKIHFDEKDILQFELNDAVNPRHRLFGTMAALIQNAHGSGVEVVAERRVVTDFSEEVTTKAEELTESEAHLKLPKFLPGYVAWEHQSGHHDPLTDIFSLGLLLASVSCGLDLNNDDDFQIFVENRTYLFAINSRLNPVIASVIVQMTELQRSKRAPDLVSLIQKLRNYRGQPTEYDFDLNRVKGFQESDIIGKRRLIQRHLRDRLFEISRRNRLLYFKPSQQQVNLTLSSVPAVMDCKNIRLDQLFVWHEQVAELIAKQTVIPLNRFVRFDDAPYVPELLEKIISEAKRDRTEYGFAQLKLVICFLRWNNLKEAPLERIISPLLLIPVELTKKKGVRDSFTLQSLSSVAELNPVLRHHLKQLYNLDLPQAIDLSETTLDKFHEHLARQIQSSEQAVTLRKIDKPQIEIVHQKARQRLDQYRKRQKLSSHTASGYSKLNHSYKKEDFRPMGLQLFLQKVRVPASPFEGVLGQITEHPMPQFIVNGEIDSKKSANVIEKEKLTYNLRDPEDQNPYIWGFDLCNITLGNFNYRKMSLVADYNHLVDKDLPNPAFDRIFSLQPKALPSIKKPELRLGEQFTVVACDPTQAGAIAQARLGESFIIQGPPGTGKSQTITNLIADYIALNKRVLFVCEKRAAIDVVYHRLSQQGLNELCCLIHDSQTDKKAFIQDVSQTYERLMKGPLDLEQAERERMEVVRDLEQHLNALIRFEEAMEMVAESAGLSVRHLLRRLVSLREHLPTLTNLQEETLAPYREWVEYGHLLKKVASELEELGEDPRWSVHALRWINPEIFDTDQPLEAIRNSVASILPGLDRIEKALERFTDLKTYVASPHQFSNLVQVCKRLKTLADHNLLDLLNPKSELSSELKRLITDTKDKEVTLDKARKNSEAWQMKLSVDDCTIALGQAEELEKRTLAWLSSNYWKLKKLMAVHYNLKHHRVERTWVMALKELKREHEAQEALETLERMAEFRFGQSNLTSFVAQLDELRGIATAAEPEVKQFLGYLRNSSSGSSEIQEMLKSAEEFVVLNRELKTLLLDYFDYPWLKIREIVLEFQTELPLIRELGSVLGELKKAPPRLAASFRHLPLAVEELEGALARKSLHGIYREDRHLSRFEGKILAEKIEQMQELYQRLLASNGRVIAARQQQRFIQNVNVSSLPAAQLNPDQKLFKKAYSTGRRELEHEFGKSMRYRAIRDLGAGNTGKVLADIKPVWLMSPLSVSDTLPLEAGFFDVVIFDEASQIPVEDAIPALYRASQVIVVGDQMQLPPTKFFASSNQSEEESLILEEDEEKVEISLEADSFLSQSALNLPSTMLGWHYRSRSEALIGYSNAAFYSGALLTIPDRSLPNLGQCEINVKRGQSGEDFVDRLLERSLSFHFHSEGVYEDRRNRSEADYIAGLVRALLLKQTGKSLGIVAFSEAQQTEIETALKRLGEQDTEFRELLEKEQDREEHGQFCGLFVKNLENVQGDERDVILLSVCYGYDRNRRMLMNFGPINQRGGEKRLNVIFSRAKEHMAVVSSIRYTDIKNEYNDGANNLRLFLQYAEVFSRGEWDNARRILSNLNPDAKKAFSHGGVQDEVIEQLAAGLRQRGWIVDQGVGQSRFRCDLAIRNPQSQSYVLGLFVDLEERVRSCGTLERFVFQPRVLKGFGWRFAHVLIKDWFHDAKGVLARLERQIQELLESQAKLPKLGSTDVEALDLTSSPDPIVNTAESEGLVEDGKSEVVVKVENAPLVLVKLAELEVELTNKEDAQQNPLKAEPGATSFEFAGLVVGRTYRLEYTEGKSKKFWEITINTQDATKYVTRYGKIGTYGQQQNKTWPNEILCGREATKLVQDKLAKGYLLV